MEKELLNNLSKQERTIKKLRRSLKKISKIEPNNFSNLLKLKEEISSVEKSLNQRILESNLETEISEYVEDIKKGIPSLEERLKGKFGHELESVLQENIGEGFKLRGHFPELKTLFYTLELRLESGKLAIWYGPKQDMLTLVKAEPKTVAQKLKKVHEGITNREMREQEFLSNLFRAYNLALQRDNKSLGEPIAIKDVLLEFALLNQDNKFRIDPVKRNFRDYGRVYFSYDLSRLKKRRINSYEIHLVTATRAYTKKRGNFLWVPSNDSLEGGYFSHIKFRRVEDGHNS